MATASQILLVGAGVMGSQHARVIAGSDRAQLAGVVDLDSRSADLLGDSYGVPSFHDLSHAPSCDGAVVATPIETHAVIAMALLERGIPLLIEKPVAPSFEDTLRIIEESRRCEVPIMCGFVERFNPVVKTAIEMLVEPPIHTMSRRHSPSNRGIKAGVVADLLIHDLDLAIRFMKSSIQHVQSRDFRPTGSPTVEIVDCILQAEDSSLASLSANRMSQRKIREWNIVTPSHLMELDLLRADLTLYRNVNQEQVIDGSIIYRAETVVDVPFIRHVGEPLALQMAHFLDLIDGRSDPETERASLVAPHKIAQTVEDK